MPLAQVWPSSRFPYDELVVRRVVERVLASFTQFLRGGQQNVVPFLITVRSMAGGQYYGVDVEFVVPLLGKGDFVDLIRRALKEYELECQERGQVRLPISCMPMTRRTLAH